MSAENKGPAGPPTAGGPAYLAVGKIRRPHGVHGEVVVEIYTDFPERIKTGTTLYLGSAHTRLTISSQRTHNEGLLLGFEGITTPEKAGMLRNQILSISAADAHKLEQGEYFHHDLVGLNVVDESGKPLGTLTEIIETGANDVYVVTNGQGGELLLPAIKDVILKVDLKAKTMKVQVLPGLMEEKA